MSQLQITQHIRYGLTPLSFGTLPPATSYMLEPLSEKVATGETRMQVKNCQRYRIMLKNRKIASIEMSGHKVRSFTQPDTKNKLPKLYVVKSGSEVIYVGVTSQSIRNRLRYGLEAQGKSGYHGYKWKDLSEVDILIWCFPKESLDRIEAVEAELVYLFRQHTGKWPKYQMEIHFHNAPEDEIKAAEAIFSVTSRCVTAISVSPSHISIILLKD